MERRTTGKIEDEGIYSGRHANKVKEIKMQRGGNPPY